MGPAPHHRHESDGANQEIGRLHVRSREASGPDAEPVAEPEWDLELIERAINGVELPDYAGVPDSGAPAASQSRVGLA